MNKNGQSFSWLSRASAFLSSVTYHTCTEKALKEFWYWNKTQGCSYCLKSHIGVITLSQMGEADCHRSCRQKTRSQTCFSICLITIPPVKILMVISEYSYKDPSQSSLHRSSKQLKQEIKEQTARIVRNSFVSPLFI